MNTNTDDRREPDGQTDFLNTDKPAEQDKSEQHRRGGPYTNEQQAERRKQVYDLHFKQNKSALEIAEIVGVNRNTVNEDIRVVYSQISQEIGGTNLSSLTMGTIHRLELQRARLTEQLDKTGEFEDRMKVDQMILNINVKIAQLAAKIVTSGKQLSPSYDSRLEEISEDGIREVVRDLAFHSQNGLAYKTKIESEYIRKTKCDTATVNVAMKKLLALGLQKFKCESDINAKDWPKEKFEIVEFASMRGYLTAEEVADIKKKYK